ncbi:MAG: hypothetical protein JSS38_09850 [Nitrospira sp.]|nr:hypothetical protein [Nitrospira sp.]
MATARLLEKQSKERERPADSIHCFRCRGLMIVEESFDSIAGAAHGDFLVRRCVQCGEVVDPVILQNRRLQLGNDPNQTIK